MPRRLEQLIKCMSIVNSPVPPVSSWPAQQFVTNMPEFSAVDLSVSMKASMSLNELNSMA